VTDTLTERLKRELARRNVAATDNEVNSFLSRNNYNLGPDLFPDANTSSYSGIPTVADMQSPPVEDSNLLRMIGVGAWQALETAGFGIPALIAPGVAESAAPETQGERIAAALGGVAGFLPPFGVARVAAGGAVKAFSKYGTKRVSAKLAKDATKVLKADKEFVTWAKETGKSATEIDEIASALIAPAAHRVGMRHIGGTKMSNKAIKAIAHDAKGRAKFVKDLGENVPKYLREGLENGGVKLSDDAITNITRMTTDAVGGLGKRGWGGTFPATTLQEHFAASWGNSKLANIAAHSVEEAILFTAVEFPMRAIQAAAYEGIEFEPGSTIMHAALLGSSLGLIRLIPGGRSTSLLSGSLSKTAQSLRTRRNYGLYRLDNPVDRAVLGKAAKSILEKRSDLGKTLRGIGGGSFTTNGEKMTASKIDDMIKTPQGAQEVKDWLMLIEREFSKRWWPEFIKDTPKDIFGSLPRMVAGSMAFNFGMLFTDEGDGMPWSEKVFHVALGAVLSKSGKDLMYRGRDGKWETSREPRPKSYSKDFIKVDNLLNALEHPNTSLVFQDIVNQVGARDTELLPDVDSADVQKIFKIFKDNKLVVPFDSPVNSKDTNVEYNELYSTIASYIERNVIDIDKNRVKLVDELSATQVDKVLRALNDEYFDGVEKYVIKRGDNATNRGLRTVDDFRQVMFSASEDKYNQLVEMESKGFLTGYDEMVVMEAARFGREETSDKLSLATKGGLIPVRALQIDPSDTTPDFKRVQSFVATFNESYDKHYFNVDKSNPIRLDAKMQERLVELMVPFEEQLSEFLLKAKVTHPDNRVMVGDSMFQPIRDGMMMRGALNRSYLALADMKNNSTKTWLTEEGREDHLGIEANELISDIFSENGTIVDRVYHQQDGKVFKGLDGIFISNLHKVIKSNPTFLQSNKKFTQGIESSKSASVSKVRRLREIFNRNGLGMFEVDDPGFISEVSSFGFNRFMGGLKRTDGKALTSAEMEGLQYMMEKNLISPTLEVHDIFSVVSALTQDVLGPIKADELKSIKSRFSKMTPEEVMQAQRVIKDKYGDDSLAAFEKFTRESGKTPEDIFSDMVNEYTEYIEPFMKKPGAGGFLKPSAQQVAITPELLFEVTTALHGVSLQGAGVMSSDLVSAARRAEGATSDADFKSFFAAVQRTMFGIGQPKNVATAVGILTRSKLYNPITKAFDMEGSKEDVMAKIQQIYKENEYQFQYMVSDNAQKNLFEKSVSDFEELYPTDKSITPSVNAYVKKYAFSLAEGLPDRTLTEDLRALSRDMDLHSFLFEQQRNAGGELSKGYEGATLPEKQQFDRETSRIYNLLKESIPVKRIKAVEGNGAFYTKEVMQRSLFYDFMSDIQGDSNMHTIDLTWYSKTGHRNSRNGDVDAFNKVVDVIAASSASVEAGAPESTPFIGPNYRMDNHSPMYTITIGDMGHGFGIPVGSADVWSRKFVDLVEKRKKEFKKDAKWESLYQPLFNKIDNFIKKRIELERDETGNITDVNTAKFKALDAISSSNELQYMVNVMFGDHGVQGREWWTHLAETRDYQDPAAVAKVLRRLRLFANESSTTLRKPFLSDLADLDQYTGTQVSKTLKRLSKRGSSIQILDDEGTTFFDVSRDLSREIETTRENAHDEYKDTIIGLQQDPDTGKFRYEGGRESASKVDSVTPISYDFLDALLAVSGLNRDSGVENMKPLITKGGDGVIVGKTLFTASHDWHNYLTKNNIDMLMFGSGNKMLGKMYEKLIVKPESDGISDIDALMGADYRNNNITLDVESIGLINLVAPKHYATAPYHLSNDIASSDVANEYFEWMFRDAVDNFSTYMGQISGTDANRSIGYMKGILGALDIDNPDASSALEMWLGGGGHPLASPMADLAKNAMKKKFIDDAGLITPRVTMGGQSVIIPDAYQPGHAKALRNSVFYRDKGGKAKQYTFGQFMAPVWSRNSRFKEQDLFVIEHNKDRPDALVKWDREVHGDLNGKKYIGEAFDVLQQTNRDKGTTYEIETVIHRTPSTRASDKVIAGIKGFDATGNAAIVNSADALYRLEADFDVDKVNFWWNTPSKVLKVWESNAGNPLSVEPLANEFNEQIHRKSSIEKLDWLDPASIRNYNIESGKASIMRGVEVKMRGLVQYLTYYDGSFGREITGADGSGGFSFQSSRGRVSVNWDEGNIDKVNRAITRDIQEIVDSTTGYDPVVHNNKWVDRILFGELNNEDYPGLFKAEGSNLVKGTKEWIPAGKWSMLGDNRLIEREAIKAVMQPYSTLLQIRSDVYQLGKKNKVRYDDMVTMIDEYSRQVGDLNGYVKFVLSHKTDEVGRKLFSKAEIDGLFRPDINRPAIKNVFTMPGAKVTSQNFPNQLPFERVMFNIASKDKMTPDGPGWYGSDMRVKFEEHYNKFFHTDKEDAAIKGILNTFKDDVHNIGLLNHTEFKIKRLSNVVESLRRRGLTEMAANAEASKERAQLLSDKLNEAIVTDESVAKALSQHIERSISKQVLLTGKYNNKPIEGDRRKWIQDNKNRIRKDVWDSKNKRLAIRFKSINNNDYLSTVIFGRILRKVSEPIIDPRSTTDPRMMNFEKRIVDFRAKYRKAWVEYFENMGNRKVDPFMDSDAISNIAMQELGRTYSEYNSIHGGLGDLFLMKMMAPKPDPLTWTYFNGKVSEGYSDTSPLFLRLGMRFMASSGYYEGGRLNASNTIAGMGRAFTNHWKAFHGQRVDAEEMADQKMLEYDWEDRAMAGAPAHFIDYFERPVDHTNAKDQMTPEMMHAFGMSDSYTLDYLLFNSAPNEKFLLSLKDAFDINFIPEWAVDASGRSRRLWFSSSYLGGRLDDATMFLGPLFKGSTIKIKEMSSQGYKYGEGMSNKTMSSQSLKDYVERKHMYGVDEDVPRCR